MLQHYTNLIQLIGIIKKAACLHQVKFLTFLLVLKGIVRQSLFWIHIVYNPSLYKPKGCLNLIWVISDAFTACLMMLINNVSIVSFTSLQWYYHYRPRFSWASCSMVVQVMTWSTIALPYLQRTVTSIVKEISIIICALLIQLSGT